MNTGRCSRPTAGAGQNSLAINDPVFEESLAAAQAGLAARRPREAQGQAEAALAMTDPGRGCVGSQRMAFARAALATAAVRAQLGDAQGAEELARRAAGVLDEAPAAQVVECVALSVAALGVLGEALRAQGRYGEAELSLQAALTLADSAPNGELLVSQAANNLAVLYKYTARFDEAEALYRRALEIVVVHRGAEHVDAATLWHNLGGLEHSRGRPATAEPAARRALEIRTRALGPAHPDAAADAAALGAILDALGRPDEAEELLRQALETFTALLGPCHYEIAINANNLAALQYRCGQFDEADTLWHQALTIKRQLLGDAHPELAAIVVNLGVLAAARGHDEEARVHFRRALQLLGSDITSDHPVHRAATQSLAALAGRA